MASFIGEYSAKIDDKGRMVFPSAFKSLCTAEELAKGFVIKKSLFADCLEMYPYSEWEKESENVRSRLNLFNKKHDMVWRQYLRDRAIVVPDEKTGRITVPKKMLDSVGISREVAFSGLGFKIEIWDSQTYAGAALDSEQYLALAQEILG